MMAAKQGVSMMRDSICNACMHDARVMQQVANISQFINKVQHTSFQPYSSHTRIQWRVSFSRIFGLGLNINRGY